MPDETHKGTEAPPPESEPDVRWKNLWVAPDQFPKLFDPAGEQVIGGQTFEVRIFPPNKKGFCRVYVGFRPREETAR